MPCAIFAMLLFCCDDETPGGRSEAAPTADQSAKREKGVRQNQRIPLGGSKGTRDTSFLVPSAFAVMAEKRINQGWTGCECG